MNLAYVYVSEITVLFCTNALKFSAEIIQLLFDVTLWEMEIDRYLGDRSVKINSIKLQHNCYTLANCRIDITVDSCDDERIRKYII